jgi:two-component system phosphate regulon sensor histidine kinase PhoR
MSKMNTPDDTKLDVVSKIENHSNDVSVFMHEIKNPLNNVYLLVQSIEADPSPENIKQSTLLIKQSIKQIQSIERDFNEYRSTGKTTIRPSTVSINALISDLIEEYRPMANKYQVTLVPSYKIGRIYTDATKLRQILGNLISNGIKYNKPNGTVVMTHFSAGNMLKISVKDTGIGMDKKELESMGTPFYRSKRNDSPGTGLGMALIYKIVQELRWKIDIKSDKDLGTEVILSVPWVTS